MKKSKTELCSLNLAKRFSQDDFFDKDNCERKETGKCRAVALNWVRRLCSKEYSDSTTKYGISYIYGLQDEVSGVSMTVFDVIEKIEELVRNGSLNRKWGKLTELSMGEITTEKQSDRYKDQVVAACLGTDLLVDMDEFNDFAEKIVESIWEPTELIVIPYKGYHAFLGRIEEAERRRTTHVDVPVLERNYSRAVLVLDFVGYRNETDPDWPSSVGRRSTAHSVAIDINKNTSILFMDPNIGEIKIESSKSDLRAFMAQWLALMGTYGCFYITCTASYYGDSSLEKPHVTNVRKPIDWVYAHFPFPSLE